MMLMPEIESCFIDSNIWLYAFLGDDQKKKEAAQLLIKSSSPVISVQVNNEVCVNLRKQAKFDELKISQLIESFYK